MDVEAEIDRLYGLPLDEFVNQRSALAKQLRSSGERDGAEQVKGLRKPTAGAWALNQAVRRRSSETSQLLAAGERLRAAHEALLSGGGREDLRSAMADERSLVAVVADCAEAIASETGKSGPALKERVRATLHAAALDEVVRAQVAAGRLVREHEAVGLGALGGVAGADEAEPAAPAPARSAAARDRERAEALLAAESLLEEARAAVDEAEAWHSRAASELEVAAAALGDAREAERKTRAAEREAAKLVRERQREAAKREREASRLRG